VEQLLESPGNLERVAVIFNPASGTEDAATRRAALEQLAQAAGLACPLAETDAARGATPLAEEAVRDGMERVLVAGGDGSVCEAAGALAGTETALAVLPGGTGNLLALNLGLPTDGAAAMRLALTAEPSRLDVGRANGTVFLIMAGMGLDAQLIQDADRELKDRLGALAYFVSAVRHLRRPPARYTITIDGQRFHRRAQTVLVANLGRITGGVELVPGADPGDGRLDVAILRGRGVGELARFAWRTLLGRRRGDPGLEIHRGRHIVIETGSPQPVQLDGNEAGPTTRLEVQVEPGALRVVQGERGDTGENVEVAPVVTLTRGAGAAGWPLLVGGSAAACLHWRALARRRRGHRPNWLERHPLLAGVAVGLGAVVLQLTQRMKADSAP
jgi:YegS/Rv2252/BmrU family lipid kinase